MKKIRFKTKYIIKHGDIHRQKQLAMRIFTNSFNIVNKTL